MAASALLIDGHGADLCAGTKSARDNAFDRRDSHSPTAPRLLATSLDAQWEREEKVDTLESRPSRTPSVCDAMFQPPQFGRDGPSPELSRLHEHLEATASKLLQMSRQIADLRNELDAQRNEFQAKEFAAQATIDDGSLTKMELRQINERLNSVTKMVSSERAQRETSLQGIMGIIDGVQEAVKLEKISRQKDAWQQLTTIQEFEAKLVAALYKRCESAQNLDSAQVPSLICEPAGLQESTVASNDSRSADGLPPSSVSPELLGDMHALMRSHYRDIVTFCGGVEKAARETSSRVLTLEERCNSLESQIAGVVSKVDLQEVNFSQRYQSLERDAKVVRSAVRMMHSGWQGLVERFKSFEKACSLATPKDKEEDGQDGHEHAAHEHASARQDSAIDVGTIYMLAAATQQTASTPRYPSSPRIQAVPTPPTPSYESLHDRVANRPANATPQCATPTSSAPHLPRGVPIVQIPHSRGSGSLVVPFAGAPNEAHLGMSRQGRSLSLSPVRNAGHIEELSRANSSRGQQVPRGQQFGLQPRFQSPRTNAAGGPGVTNRTLVSPPQAMACSGSTARSKMGLRNSWSSRGI